MSNNPQKFNGGEYVDKARDAARDNPDKARSAIDKVQEAANRRTGGKFGSLIEKAGDFVEDKLGLPAEAKDEPRADPKADSSAEPKAEPTPEPQAEPAQPKAEPAQPEGQSDSTGPGKLPG
jgi:hypothetical protein